MKEVAEMLFKAHNIRLKQEDINCTGCVKATMEGTAIIGHCEACELRKCAKEKSVPTCAHYPNYFCDILKIKWSQIPNGAQAEENLKDVEVQLGYEDRHRYV